MRSFDRDAWTEAAEARHEKLIAGANKQAIERADQKLKAEKKAIESLRVVVEWCEARSLNVSFGKILNGVFYPAEKKVLISGRASPQKQLCYLLHECGHFLIDNCSSEKTKVSRWGSFEDPDIGWTSKRYRVEIVDEEIEAWKRGEKLAARLGLEIDTRTFNAVKAESLITYMKWASRPNRKAGNGNIRD